MKWGNKIYDYLADKFNNTTLQLLKIVPLLLNQHF